MWSSKNISEYLGLEIPFSFEAKRISIDTRDLEKGDLYIALRGENHDGNKFAEDAVKKGAAAVIIDNPAFQGVKNSIMVKDCLEALQRLAYKKRRNTKAKFIAITGSVGKTTAKELISHVLSQYYRVYATKGNLNNHIGLPLTIVNMPDDTQYAVVEMGMNHKGEISDLCRIAHPHIAGITWVSEAHIENFDEGIEGIAKAKAEIMEFLVPDGAVFIPSDNNNFGLLEEIAEENGVSDIISFGRLANEYEEVDENISAIVIDQKVIFPKILCERFVDNNVLFALNIASYLSLDLDEAVSALMELQPVKGRGGEIQHKSGAIIIDDSYNASPESMKKALLNLVNRKAEGRKIAVLGDMKELGKNSKKYHESLNEYLTGVDFLITCGKDMQHLHEKAKMHSKQNNIKELQHFEGWQKLSEVLPLVLRKGDVVLIKGSHGSNMWKVVDGLNG